MMVVVPPLSAGDDGHPYVVAAVIVRFVVAIAEQVRKGIPTPRDVPNQNGSDHHAPEPDACSKLQGRRSCIPQRQTHEETAREIQYGLREHDSNDGTLQPSIEFVAQYVAGVPVISRRAVQISIFDEKPAHISPKQADQRTMRIWLVVSAVMMQAMGCYPSGRRVLDAAHGNDRKSMLKP